jgi:hypothetical protein
MSSSDVVYRVKFMPDGDTVDVITLGMDCLDLPHQGTYSKDEMPEWMRDKLAALALFPSPPPSNEVAGVGKRIADTIFWVYPT